MKKYNVELDTTQEEAAKRFKISEEFDNKLLFMLNDIILKEELSFSCTDSIVEIKNICTNDNEFAYACIQVGRMFENPNIQVEVIKECNRRRNKVVN